MARVGPQSAVDGSRRQQLCGGWVRVPAMSASLSQFDPPPPPSVSVSQEACARVPQLEQSIDPKTHHHDTYQYAPLPVRAGRDGTAAWPSSQDHWPSLSSRLSGWVWIFRPSDSVSTTPRRTQVEWNTPLWPGFGLEKAARRHRERKPTTGNKRRSRKRRRGGGTGLDRSRWMTWKTSSTPLPANRRRAVANAALLGCWSKPCPQWIRSIWAGGKYLEAALFGPMHTSAAARELICTYKHTNKSPRAALRNEPARAPSKHKQGPANPFPLLACLLYNHTLSLLRCWKSRARSNLSIL